MAGGFLQGWIGLRARYRGLLLPLYAAWLAPAALIYLIGNDTRGVAGCGLGMLLTWLASKRLRRGQQGDTRGAAILLGVGTFLAAHLAAKLHVPLSLLMGAGAFFGTRMLHAELPEAAPPPPPPEPPPPPAPPGPVDEARERLERITSAARWLQDGRLQGVAAAMGSVLDDLSARPERLPMARRFLAVHLDGLERITERLQAGAAPPEGLGTLLDDLTRAANDLREKVRREESEALEIQVKVLSDRLKQEGFA
jgi:hypothetical protein